MRPDLRRSLYETNLALRLPAGPARRQLLRDYWSLRVRQTRGGSGPGRASILGWDVEYFDLATFTFVFEEIFIDRIYEVDLPTAPTIIDCGANVGLATLFFARRHPGAHITAIEPGPSTFATLERNLDRAGLRDVRRVHAAASDREGTITLYDDTGPGSVGASTIPRASGTTGTSQVTALRLSSLVEGPVDLLKLDVEGAELTVLHELADSGRLADVDRVVVDYNHHRDGRDDLATMLALLDGAGFRYQLSAPVRTPFVADEPQDMILYAYRPA